MNRKETISILGGTGDLGTGLALRLLNAGYSIVIGSRTLKKAKKASSKLGINTVGMTNKDAASVGDIIILTVPFAHQRTIVEEWKIIYWYYSTFNATKGSNSTIT